MSALVTEAIVLHAFDYLESSRIIRLLTRDAGIQSVVARGARTSRKRFGSAVDLFAQGTAEIQLRPNRDLHTLISLEISQGRAPFSLDVGRFTAGSMIAELALRSTSDEEAPGFFDAVEAALDSIARADVAESAITALAGAWQMIATLGFAPTLDLCAACHAHVPPGQIAAFCSASGGVLCGKCAGLVAGTRKLPPSARDNLRGWLAGEDATALPLLEVRAHQRLLREFFHEHIATDKELPAYGVWERGDWSAA